MNLTKTIEEEKRYVGLIRDWFNKSCDLCEKAIEEKKLNIAEQEMSNLSWLLTEVHESALRLRRLKNALHREQLRNAWSGYRRS